MKKRFLLKTTAALVAACSFGFANASFSFLAICPLKLL
jgi:hypothetical protein